MFLSTFPLFALGQTIESEKNGSIQIGTFTFPTYTLQINNYSASDPAKVFIIPVKSFDSLKRLIPRLYFSKKQEYNEYYVLGVDDISHTQIVKPGVREFLKQIDSARVERNRSTFLRLYSWDNINKKVIYQATSKDLSQVDNLYYLNSTKDICKYMGCPKK